MQYGQHELRIRIIPEFFENFVEFCKIADQKHNQDRDQACIEGPENPPAVIKDIG